VTKTLPLAFTATPSFKYSIKCSARRTPISSCASSVDPPICGVAGGFPPHHDHLLPRGFVPARGQIDLVLGLAEAPPFAGGVRHGATDLRTSRSRRPKSDCWKALRASHWMAFEAAAKSGE